ncbi:FtsX-like permease family protein [Paenibacillus sp. PAMC21692]|uniref:FtsX-like permease family protein n=1 Tax=Paenibacillus sp. PAMC21692 TaxID=2762320 RepID=UPI0021C3FD5B|nr:FtsX-like permease family protein [Paenibacillus sp. PAMC21692]
MITAIWKLGKSYLVKNKVQNAFVALLVLLSALLVCTATIIVSNTGDRFDEMHMRTNGSHQILTFEKKLHDPEAVQHWWQSQQGVQTSDLMRYHTLSGIVHKGKDIPNLYMFMMETPKSSPSVDQLIVTEGNTGVEPAPGTIWIPTSMAYPVGISLGDEISIPVDGTKLELQVSAIVVDVPYGAPFSNTARVWMNHEDYETRIDGLDGGSNYLLGLRFDNYEDNLAYWHSFSSAMGTPFLESKMEFEEISAFYLIINQIVGFIMIFLGAVMLIIALLTIGFTISDGILANYRTIGVYKSLGMTSRATILPYLMQYGLLSAAAILPAFALSTVLAKMIIDLSASSLRTPGSGSAIQGIGAAVIVAILVFALVLLFVVVYARRARAVMPAQAIRYGMSEGDSKRLLSRSNAAGSTGIRFGHLPVSAAIGLRNLLINRKGTVIMLILMMLASSVLTLGSVVLSSIGGIQGTAAQWGYDSADAAAMVVNKSSFPFDEFEQSLASDSRISGFGWQGNMTAIAQSGSLASDQQNSASAPASSISLSILDGSYEELGFANLEGDHPVLRNEISIGVQVARNLNKQPGDTIDVYIAGQRVTMIVTGIYQAIANMSNSARITMEGALAVYPDFNNRDVAFINVFNPKEANAVVSDLNGRFKETASIVTQGTLLDSVYNQASAILVYPMSLMGLLFLLATFLIIYSTCRINIRLASKTYGIYKSIGMTSGRIRGAIALGIVALAFIGTIPGIVLGIFVLPVLLEMVLSGYGIVSLPVILNGGSIAGAAMISIAAAFFGSWASSKVIRDTSPRILTID